MQRPHEIDKFEYYIERKVTEGERDPSQASSLLKRAESKFETMQKLGVDEDTATDYLENVYECCKMLVQSLMAAEGFKPYSHEAIIAYAIDRTELDMVDINTLNRYRKLRNDIAYRGEIATTQEAYDIRDLYRQLKTQLEPKIEEPTGSELTKGRKMNLESLFERDERVEEVYQYAKQKYREADLCQHNWGHIVRNLYRALKIAETEDDVDYPVLVVSVLFHDIGVTGGDYERHEERSVEIAERELPDVGFSEDEIGEITHAIETVGEEADSETIEAKICSDADKLVKSGFASVFNFFRVQKEFGKPLDRFTQDVIDRQQRLRDIGFYTDKAEEISDNGFEERKEFLEKFSRKLAERPDFTATEEDLNNL